MFTVHTNAIVVNIRISIGDLIAGVGDKKTFATGGKHPRVATVQSTDLMNSECNYYYCCDKTVSMHMHVGVYIVL